MPLTAAEKSKRYRDKLKQKHPEKYRQLLEACSRRAQKSYRAKLYAKLNEEEKEEFRLKWRERKRSTNKKRKGQKNIVMGSDLDNPSPDQTSQFNTTNTNNLNKYFDNVRKSIQRTLRNENAKLRKTLLSLKKDHDEVLEKLRYQQQQIKQMDEKLFNFTKDLRREQRRSSSVETVLELVDPDVQVKVENADTE